MLLYHAPLSTDANAALARKSHRQPSPTTADIGGVSGLLSKRGRECSPINSKSQSGKHQAVIRRPELRPFAELWRCWLRNEDCGKQELDQLSDSGPARAAIATREVFAVMYHKVAEPTPRKAKQRGPSNEDKRGWAPLATQVAKLTLLVPPSTLHLRRCDMQLDIIQNLCLQNLAAFIRSSSPFLMIRN